MKILLFEDEKLASDRLIQLLQSIQPEVEILASLKSVEAALLWLQNNPAPELIISDIQLLDGVSFDIFEQSNIKCPVIFTTAYDDYAIKAFEVNSIDYLLKPIQKEKLAIALQKFEAQINKTSHIDMIQIRELLQEKPEYKSRFLVKFGQNQGHPHREDSLFLI